MKITEDQWTQAAKWREEGMTMKAIGEKLGVSQGRVSQRLGKRRVNLVESEKPWPLSTG